MKKLETLRRREVPVATPACLPGAPRTQPDRTRLTTSLGRFFVECGFTVLLLGLVAYGAWYVDPAISGPPEHPQSATSAWVAAFLGLGDLALLSLIERLLPPAGPRKSLKSWFLHFQINVFLAFVVGIAAALTTVATSLVAKHFGFKLGLIDLRFAEGRGLPGFLGSLWVSAIAGDFFFYWFHRALHKTPILWAHHKMHHMDRELEAVTLTRQNWVEALLGAVLIYIPSTIVFKVDALDPAQLGLVGGAFATVFGTLVGIGHMNVRFQVGKASVFFCSPQVHRIHHSYLPQHQDKNFAFIFPLWDVLFGSYYAPKWNEFPPTGVEGEKEIQSFWESQIFTPREWWRMYRAWRRQRDIAPV